MKHAVLLGYAYPIFFFSIVINVHAQQGAWTDPFLDSIERNKKFSLNMVPGISDLSMPQTLRDFLYSLSITEPVIEKFPNAINPTTVYITSDIVFKDTPITVRVRFAKQDDAWSIMIALNNGFDFSKIDPRLSRFGILTINKAFLVFNPRVQSKDIRGSPSVDAAGRPIYKQARSYIDPGPNSKWNITVEPGVNLILFTQVMGVLARLLSIVPGLSQTELILASAIQSDFGECSFKAHLPGTLKFGTMGESLGLILALYFKKPPPGVVVGAYELVFSIQTGFKLKIPRQDELLFLCELQLVNLRKISISGWMVGFWSNAFGIRGFGLGELGLQVGQDLAVEAVSLGTIPISELCLKAGVSFGTKKIILTTCADLELSNWFLAGTLDGTMYLQDAIDFGADMISRAANILGQKVSLVKKVQGIAPRIGFKSSTLYVVPQDTYVFGKKYEKGITCDVIADLFGKEVGLGITTTDTKLYAKGYIEKFTVGPLTVGGMGSEKVTKVPEGASAIVFNIDPTSKNFAEFYLDGSVQLVVPRLGNLNAATRVEMTLEGVSMQIGIKIFEYFDAYVRVWGSGPVSSLAQQQMRASLTPDAIQQLLNNPATSEDRKESLQVIKTQIEAGLPYDLSSEESWGMHLRMRQTALQALNTTIKETAQAMIDSAKVRIETSRQGILQINKTLEIYDAAIAQLQQQIAQEQQSNKESLSYAIAQAEKAQEKLNSYAALRKELDDQIARCKGASPQDAQAAQTLLEEIPVSQADRIKAVQEYIQTMNLSPDAAQKLMEIVLQASPASASAVTQTAPSGTVPKPAPRMRAPAGPSQPVAASSQGNP